MNKRFDLLYPLRCVHGYLFEAQKEHKNAVALCKRIEKIPFDTLLFVLTPTHGNMGDHAIAYSAKLIFKSFGLEFAEITNDELTILKKHKKIGCMDGHPIVVNGGGNIGTLWPSVEELFREIIMHNPNSRILCLPNTAYFDDSYAGQKEFAKSQQIYNSHPHLTICAREEVTYRLLEKHVNNVVLIPDLALFLNECSKDSVRKGCMICLRSDREKLLCDADKKKMVEELKVLFGENLFYSDMNICKAVPVSQREIELQRKFDEFRGSELVVTDRLHGMVFAAITGTPCVVLASKSPKVKGCYKWINDLEYIQFAESINDAVNLCKNMPRKSFEYDQHFFGHYYDTLKEIITQMVE